MSQDDLHVHRVLAIDDDPAIQEDYRLILKSATSGGAKSESLRAVQANDGAPACPLKKCAACGGTDGLTFELDSATNGKTGLDMAGAALKSGKRYDIAIVDISMTTGWDGIETVESLWQLDPELEIVICSAYSDQPWDGIARRLGRPGKLLLLRKPFEAAELWQAVRSLAEKREAEAAVRDSLHALELANQQLRLQIEAEHRADENPMHDPLTALPNRLLLHDRLKRCIERMVREPSYSYAVLFLDLDNFKEVNDNLGLESGDALLKTVGKRLSGLVRIADTAVRDSSLATRLGGDEFVLVLDGIRNAEEVEVVTNRIARALAEPIDVNGQSILVGASMGYAMGTREHQTPDEILRDADAALYHAKRQGRQAVCGFDDSIRDKVLTRRRLSKDLKDAAEHGQISLLYQPLLSLDQGIIEGFEALARWRHPDLGPISPGVFIPISEEDGHIFGLGEWVLRTACRQLCAWRERFPANTELAMSVNVSHRQVVDARFLPMLKSVLNEFELPGRFLAIEITESVFADNIEATTSRLEAIRDLGVQLHLDDFGTGFSSLSMFHRLPVDAIKVDRSFVTNMRTDGHVANIVQAILMMAENRKLKVIAEGIESSDQLIQLQALGCPSGQGYLLSRPMPPEAIELLLSNGGLRLPELPDGYGLQKSA